MRGFEAGYTAAFSQRRTVVTDMGGALDTWVLQFEERASVMHRQGGEAVMQARLASRSIAEIMVLSTTDTRRVTSEWQVELRGLGGFRKVYQLREDPRPSEGRMYLRMLVEG